MELEFSQQFFEKKKKKFQIPNFMKNRPVRAELFYADRWKEGGMDRRTDGRTDRHDEANSRFSEFCERA